MFVMVPHVVPGRGLHGHATHIFILISSSFFTTVALFSDFHCALGHIYLIDLNKIKGQLKMTISAGLANMAVHYNRHHSWRPGLHVCCC